MAFASELGERGYAGQYGQPTVGFVVHKAGVPADADANDVQVKMETLDGTTTIFDRLADHPAISAYSTTSATPKTQNTGISR